MGIAGESVENKSPIRSFASASHQVKLTRARDRDTGGHQSACLWRVWPTRSLQFYEN
jgi:hypothetical protein